MKGNSPILEVRDLLKTFGAVVAAKDINVDISQGESLASLVQMERVKHVLSIWSPDTLRRLRVV